MSRCTHKGNETDIAKQATLYSGINTSQIQHINYSFIVMWRCLLINGNIVQCQATWPTWLDGAMPVDFTTQSWREYRDKHVHSVE